MFQVNKRNAIPGAVLSAATNSIATVNTHDVGSGTRVTVTTASGEKKSPVEARKTRPHSQICNSIGKIGFPQTTNKKYRLGLGLLKRNRNLQLRQEPGPNQRTIADCCKL